MGYFELNIEPKKIYFIKVIYIDFTTSIKFQLIDIYKGLEDIKKSNSKPIEPFNKIDSEERK